MSTGFRHHHDGGSGVAIPADLRKAESLLLKKVKINNKCDIPFCSGMSEDGKTLYVDKDVPEHDKGMHIMKAIVVHELVEHLLMDELGLPYKEAHAIATAAEEACVRANGWNQHEYDQFWDKTIRKVSSRASYPNIPKDLDTEPYSQDDKKQEDDGKLGSFGLMISHND